MIDLSSQIKCVEHLTEFTSYIKDGQDGECYLSDKTNWDVAVDSNNEGGCNFVKIDKCIYNDGDESHCDCGFMTEKEFYFVEIKESIAFDNEDSHSTRKVIRKNARNQLANTINLFKRDFGLVDLRNVHAVIASKPAISIQSIRPITTRAQSAIAVFASKCGCVNLHEGNFIQIN